MGFVELGAGRSVEVMKNLGTSLHPPLPRQSRELHHHVLGSSREEWQEMAPACGGPAGSRSGSSTASARLWPMLLLLPSLPPAFCNRWAPRPPTRLPDMEARSPEACPAHPHARPRCAWPVAWSRGA